MTILQVISSDARNPAIEFAALLVDGDSLTSVTSVTVDPTGDFTATSQAISGTLVTFGVTGTIEGRRYLLTAIAVTTNGETLTEYATIAGL